MELSNSNAQIPADIRTRIIDAANQLFEEAGQARFPAVADVRRLAKTDMNATSSVMREWKRLQTAKPEPVAVSVPEPVQQAGQEQLAVVWAAALDFSNASLRSAQASWAVERDEMESMRQELAQLFEAQARELEETQSALATAIQAREAAELRAVDLADRLAQQQSRGDQAEARIREMEIRADDLKSEAARAHEETRTVRQELTEVRASHVSEIEQLNKVAAEEIEGARSALATFKGKSEAIQESLTQQLEQVQVHLLQYKSDLQAARAESHDQAKSAEREAARAEKLQTEWDKAQQDAATARETAARLTGQLEAVQQQNAALLDRLPTKPGPKK